MLDRDQFGSKKAFETATRHRITEAHLAVIRPQQAAVGYSTFDVRAAMKARAMAKGPPKGGIDLDAHQRCYPQTMTPGLPPGIDPEEVPS